MADLEIPVGFGLWSFHMQHVGIAHTAIVTLGFEVDTPAYSQAENDAALTAWRTALAPMYDNEVLFSRLTTLIGNDGPLIRFESSGVLAGTRAAQSIAPPNVTYLIRKASGFAGRRFRGRMYLPFASEGGIEQTGALTTAELVILTTAAAALEAGMVDPAIGSAGLFLLHSESTLSVTPDPTPVLNLVASNFVATQRRRLKRL